MSPFDVRERGIDSTAVGYTDDPTGPPPRKAMAQVGRNLVEVFGLRWCFFLANDGHS